MDVQALVAQARQALSVDRVFGQPFEQDGIAVLPVATVRGGGGGGGGPTGGGGGGLEARAAGVFVIDHGRVRWQPAIDPNRAMAVGLIALLVIRSMLRGRARTKRALAKTKGHRPR
ncbi:MAG: sporulation protein [Actinomycetota bacterium]